MGKAGSEALAQTFCCTQISAEAGWGGERRQKDKKRGKKIQHTLEKGKEAKGKRKVNREGHREMR